MSMLVSYFANGINMTLICLLFVHCYMYLKWMAKCLVLEWYIGP